MPKTFEYPGSELVPGRPAYAHASMVSETPLDRHRHYAHFVSTPRYDRLDLFWQCGAERRYHRGGKSNGRGENGLGGSLAHFK